MTTIFYFIRVSYKIMFKLCIKLCLSCVQSVCHHKFYSRHEFSFCAEIKQDVLLSLKLFVLGGRVTVLLME